MSGEEAPYTSPKPEDDQLGGQHAGMITLCVGLCHYHHAARTSRVADGPAAMKAFIHEVLDCELCRFQDVRVGVIDTVFNMLRDGALTMGGIRDGYREWQRHEECRCAGKCVHEGGRR